MEESSKRPDPEKIEWKLEKRFEINAKQLHQEMSPSKETHLEIKDVQPRIFAEASLFEATIKAYQREVDSGIKEIINMVEKIVLNEFPSASVNAYGSYVTGLYMHFSDVDLVISFPNSEQSNFIPDSVAMLEVLAESIVNPFIFS
jgi:DNA polymerase sigma